MPRLSGKAAKIAYKILGKPVNMTEVKHKFKSKNTQKRLIAEETARVR